MTLVLLLVAAVLEAGGDALVRLGLQASALPDRLLLYALGGVALFAYGYTVNAPPWTFGRLLGVYVVLFFLVAQIISSVMFHQPPTRAIWIGGAMVLAGGVVMTWG